MGPWRASPCEVRVRDVGGSGVARWEQGDSPSAEALRKFKGLSVAGNVYLEIVLK